MCQEKLHDLDAAAGISVHVTVEWEMGPGTSLVDRCSPSECISCD